MKPFLLLGTRAEDAAADDEYASFLACTGLGERELRRRRLEQRAQAAYPDPDPGDADAPGPDERVLALRGDD